MITYRRNVTTGEEIMNTSKVTQTNTKNSTGWREDSELTGRPPRKRHKNSIPNQDTQDWPKAAETCDRPHQSRGHRTAMTCYT